MHRFGERIGIELIFYLFFFIIYLNFNLGSNSEAQAFLQRNGQVIIRMRGLPFDANAKDVVSQVSVSISILYGRNKLKIHIFLLQINRVNYKIRYNR
jgi:hypothetical protein